MRWLRFCWTLLRATTHAVQGFWTIKTLFPKLSQADREARVQVWAGAMLRIVGIELVVKGTPPAAGPMLLVANHISWLDILVMHAARHCRFVSKADVRDWPFVRTLSDGAGSLYIERESRRDAHRVVTQMAERLRAGDILAVFPEGTTGDGITLKPFHANGAVSFAPSYVDDETLAGSIWRTLTAPPLKAVVVFGEPQLPQGQTRRVWAQALREDIERLRQQA
jgi:1-acyl-sn-glycerol-3-phosphate acyltransferase